MVKKYHQPQGWKKCSQGSKNNEIFVCFKKLSSLLVSEPLGLTCFVFKFFSTNLRDKNVESGKEIFSGDHLTLGTGTLREKHQIS